MNNVRYKVLDMVILIPLLLPALFNHKSPLQDFVQAQIFIVQIRYCTYYAEL